MKADSITNIKNNFSAFLDRVKKGEQILVLEHGRPIAQITRPTASVEGGLALLEREGLISLPQEPSVDVEKVLSDRVSLKNKTSLLNAILADREESR